MEEVQKASEVISSTVHPDAHIIFGNVIDPKMENEVKITVIATGFPKQEELDRIDKDSDKEILQDPTKMGIPPFLRMHPSARRRTRNEISSSNQLGMELN